MRHKAGMRWNVRSTAHTVSLGGAPSPTPTPDGLRHHPMKSCLSGSRCRNTARMEITRGWWSSVSGISPAMDEQMEWALASTCRMSRRRVVGRLAWAGARLAGFDAHRTRT